jgi:hypothetical protein
MMGAFNGIPLPVVVGLCFNKSPLSKDVTLRKTQAFKGNLPVKLIGLL